MATLQYSTKSQLSLALQAQSGVAVEDLFEVTTQLGLSNQQVEDTYQTSVKTLRAHRQAQKVLAAPQGEQTLKLKILLEKGEKVFGNTNSLQKWLAKSAHGLGNEVPLTLLVTSGGIDAVIQEIDRIAYGDFA